MKQTIENTVSYRLKYALRVRKLSATELSRLSNVPFSSISGYLSGKFQPKTRTLIHFAECLGTSLKWLAGEAALNAINDTRKDADDPEEQTLLNDYRQLSPEGKQFLLGMAHSASEDSWFGKGIDKTVAKSTAELPGLNIDFFKEDIIRLKTANTPNKNIFILGAITGILSYLDEKYSSDSDRDKHLSIKGDIMRNFIYWRPIDLYLALTKEYHSRIRPKFKSLNPNAAETTDIILVGLLDAISFIANWPVFPNLFAPIHRSTFLSAFYSYTEKFKLFMHAKSTELF